MRGIFCLLLIGLAQGSAAKEAPNFNLVQMRGGVEIALPLAPSTPELAESFARLSPEEKETFYQRRAFLVRKLVGAVSFPRTIGGLAWTKNKIKILVDRVRGREVEASGDPSLSFKEQGRQILETLVNIFVDKMWADAGYVANSSSVGFTLYAGPVVNTSFLKWGFFWGRGISVDIGHDFTAEKGYLRFYYDQQSLSRAGLSADVGMMFDFLIHFSDVPEDGGAGLAITHYKLPVFGCYRQGATYRAFGAQIGIHALEFAAVAIAYRHPQIAAGMLLGMRALGTATVYSTDLKRKFLMKASLPAKWVGKLIGHDREKCEETLRKRDPL